MRGSTRLLGAVLFLVAALSAQEPKEVTQNEALDHLIAESRKVWYPPLARQARIQGSVILKVQISAQGDVEDVQLVSGHPMLSGAATEAVRKWRFTPFIEDDSPISVVAPVQIDYILGESNIEDAVDQRISWSKDSLKAKNFAEAEKNLREAVAMATRRSGHERAAVKAEHALAQIELAEGRSPFDEYVAAIDLFNKAGLDAKDDLGKRVFLEAGTYFFAQADDQNAQRILSTWLAVWGTTSDQASMASVAAILGKVSLRRGELAKAAEACRVFRTHEKALHGLELDEARERCRGIR